jgi:hypothetical protein
MNYLDELAGEIAKEISPDVLPNADTSRLFRLYALLVLVKGTDVTAVDVHDAWSAWMLELDPGHRSIRPFEELDADTQASDEPYVAAIRAVAGRQRRR